MPAPVLKTPRLTLRAHRREDFPEFAAMWGDPAVTRFIGGKPQTPEEAWGRLLRYAGHWALLGFGYWVVLDKATGAFLGEAGFADYHRDLTPPLGDTPEAGWVFAPAAHGQGYASEAVQAVHDWGRTHFQTAQSACIIQPENAASLRLAARVGYQETYRAEWRGQTAIVLHRNW